jgi:hypothetical protein
MDGQTTDDSFRSTADIHAAIAKQRNTATVDVWALNVACADCDTIIFSIVLLCARIRQLREMLQSVAINEL